MREDFEVPEENDQSRIEPGGQDELAIQTPRPVRIVHLWCFRGEDNPNGKQHRASVAKVRCNGDERRE